MSGLISSGGSNAINTQFVFHYRRTATAVNPTKTALATSFQAGPAVPIIAMLNARWAEKTVSVRWMDDPLDQAVPFANVNPGAIAGDCMPSHVAVFVLYRTGLKGKRYRGGKHFGPFSESDATAAGDDILNVAAQGRLATTILALAAPITDATTNTWNPCVYSRSISSPLLEPIASIATNDVTTILYNKRFGNMKRRQVKSVY
jgi:hypothetical protein